MCGFFNLGGVCWICGEVFFCCCEWDEFLFWFDSFGLVFFFLMISIFLNILEKRENVI